MRKILNAFHCIAPVVDVERKLFMKRYIVGIAVLLLLLPSAVAQQRAKVLMIVNEGQSGDLKLMLTNEVGVMHSLLQKAGFQVVVATASKQPLVAGAAILKPDLKISVVQAADYKGLILPCMATSDKPFPPEAVAIIKGLIAKGMPVAAQTGSVLQLGMAGVLTGKKYAGPRSWTTGAPPPLKGAVYSGDGIVQDGKIITSGICPFMAKQTGRPDGTAKLTEAFIAALKK
jgi:putative intracellular protease/amidase